MQLSKRVPAKTVVLKVLAYKHNYTEMSQEFRSIRAKSRNPMDKCYWCKHEFVDGEIMALAITTKGSKMLCHPCGKQIKRE